MIPCSWDVVIPSELCPDWSGYTQPVKDSALWLASTYLWAATGRQYGACPVTVRPGQPRLGEAPAYQAYPVWPGQDPVVSGPFLFGGRWFNLGGGSCSGCCGASSCGIVLRGPVFAVSQVLVGGEVVAPSAYRVDIVNGAYVLVRIDGLCWPSCQNFTRASNQPGTFEVTYEIGRAVPEALAIATALLACQYGKHLTGGACALPAKMTRLARQGVEVEVAPPEPAQGLTGIKAVDEVVLALNPGRRKAPPMVFSPDLPEGCDRYTVIPAGS